MLDHLTAKTQSGRFKNGYDKAWNERMARIYDPDAFITRSGPCIRIIEQARLKTAARLLNAKPWELFLDVGCGSGHLMARLGPGRIYGIDLSSHLIRQAQKRLGGKNISLLEGDAQNLPFPDATFDKIACTEALEHLVNPEEALKEILRVAKPQARILITLPNEGLINITKRLLLGLGLKRWIAGSYKMSDNMLQEWHLREIAPQWVLEALAGQAKLRRAAAIPFPLAAYHHALLFEKLNLKNND